MNSSEVYEAVAAGRSYAELATELGKTQPAVRAMAGRYARKHGLPSAVRGRGAKVEAPDMGSYFQYLLLRKAMNAAPSLSPEPVPGPVDDVAEWDALMDQLAGLNRAARVLYASDQHFPDHDPLAIRMVEEIALWFGPDLIVHGGDVFDMDAISRFEKDFRKGKPDALRHARKPYQEHVTRLRRENPAAKQVYIDGNHTAPRIQAYLNDKWEFQDSILDTYHALARANGAVLYMGSVEEIEVGPLFLQHGRRTGKNAARNAQDDLGGSTPMVQGHSHTPQWEAKRVRRPGGRGYRVVQSVVSGCLSQIPASYIGHTKQSKWLQSVTLAHVEMDGDIVNLQPVVFHQRTDGSLCAYVGKKYFHVELSAEARPVEPALRIA